MMTAGVLGHLPSRNKLLSVALTMLPAKISLRIHILSRRWAMVGSLHRIAAVYTRQIRRGWNHECVFTSR